ncbi:MAG: DNA-directed RNA polymerase subunit omega [Spirochaetota bacterium]
MIIPLEDLINYHTNSYELAVAINRRAFQLAVLKTPEVEKSNGKVVSLSAQQVFQKQVDYRFIVG